MNKPTYRIKMNSHNISDDEINRYKNFDQVVSNARLTKTRSNRWKLAGSIVAVLSLTLMISLYLHFRLSPVPVKGTKQTGNVGVIKNHEIKKSNNVVIKSPTEKISDKKDSMIRKVIPPPPVENKKRISDEGFIEAEPQGGYGTLFSYFEKNLQYPPAALKEGISGTVMIQFYINTYGEAENIEIIKSISPEIDKEAIRLIEQMPEWRPARMDGKEMSVRQVIPINFIIDQK